jgi:cytochrome oxidase assembly protein ShyY1
MIDIPGCSERTNFKVVTMLSFYQVAITLSLTTCWQIVELQDDNKLLEQLVTSLLSSTTL